MNSIASHDRARECDRTTPLPRSEAGLSWTAKLEITLAIPSRGGIRVLPELERELTQLERRRHDLLARLSGLDGRQLAFHPRPQAWSLLQLAQHLALVEEGVAAARAMLEEKPVRRSWRQRIGYFAVWAVLMSGLRVRVPTRRVVPEPSPDLQETTGRWEGAQANLRDRVASLSEPGAREAFAYHPVAGPLDARETLRFLIRHFDHHLRQVSRIMAARDFPARGETGYGA